MNQATFIKQIREATGRHDFNYWHVEHLVKAGIIKPLRRGRGIPRIFSESDVKTVMDLQRQTQNLNDGE